MPAEHEELQKQNQDSKPTETGSSDDNVGQNQGKTVVGAAAAAVTGAIAADLAKTGEN